MPKPELAITPAISIHPNQLTTYALANWHPYKPARHENSLNNLTRNKHDGTLSKNAVKKLSRSTDYLLYLAQDKEVSLHHKAKAWKFKVAFITLTLSSKQQHSDKELKALFLNHFITQAKQKWNVSRFVWRAEKQANGNLHFHILVDVFIPWYELRDVWNNIQNKLGYVDRYRANMKQWHNEGFRIRENLAQFWPVHKQKKAYESGKKNDFRSPNSTDIHSVRFVKDIRAYIKKYMSKKEKELPIEGRIWGCSYDIASPEGARSDIDSLIASELGRLRNAPGVHAFEGDYFTCIEVTPDLLLKFECYLLHDLWLTYIKKFDSS